MADQQELTLWPSAFKGQCCGQCALWWMNPKSPEHGQCRCGPPSVIVTVKEGVQPMMERTTGQIRNMPVRQNVIQPHFPPMAANDPGCSQFKPKLQALESAEIGERFLDA